MSAVGVFVIVTAFFPPSVSRYVVRTTSPLNVTPGTVYAPVPSSQKLV